MPIAVVGGLILMAGGVIQSLGAGHTVTTVAGGKQTILDGPVGSWEPIKLFTGDGGGVFNANSAHPFENPSAWTNAFEIVLMLLIPTACIRMFGRMIGSLKQSWTLLTVVGILFGLLLAAGTLAQTAHTGTVTQAVGGQYEGTETRFGIPGSTLFGVSGHGLGGRRGQLLVRQLLQPRRRSAAVRDDARRDRARRHRQRAVRPDHGGPGGRLHRRPDGRPHARIPAQADRVRGDALGRRVRADPAHGDPGLHGYRARLRRRRRPRWATRERTA